MPGKRSTFNLKMAEMYAKLALKAAMRDQDKAEQTVELVRREPRQRMRIVMFSIALQQCIQLDREVNDE